jgi:hypothetical protein
MSTVATLQRHAPVFMDPKLLLCTSVHEKGCRGEIPGRPCRCGLAMWLTGESHQVCVLEKNDESAQVILAPWLRPVWVEASMLTSFRPYKAAPEGSSPASLPRDIDVLHPYLTPFTEPMIYPRRRLRPQCGQLVFIRGEIQEPWRFLAIAGAGDFKFAILIDPEVPPDQALAPDFPQVHVVELGAGESWQKLIVVYPLPDGTADPGWR